MASSSQGDECSSVTKKRKIDFDDQGIEINPARLDGNRKRSAAGFPEAESSPTSAKRLRVCLPSRHSESSLIQKDKLDIDRSSGGHSGNKECDAVPNIKKKRQAAEFSPCSAKRQKMQSDEESSSPFLSAEMYLKDLAADEVKSPSLPFISAVTYHGELLVEPESRTVTQEGGKKQASSPEAQEQSLLNKSKEHTKPHSSDKTLSTEEAQAQRCLNQHGVPLLTESNIEDMSSAGIQSLGSGTYGSCHKVVDPNTQKILVVKTFSEDGLQELVTEAINLHELRLPGVQELVGVCVHTRQIVTHFGGTTVDQFFETKPSLADTYSVFLQLARTLQNMLEKGFAHNDIKGNNVCVQVENDVPNVTIIDLGLARKVGTLEIYEEMPDTRKLPWLAPELLRYTHPCGEASDVYSLAYLLRKKLPLKKRRGKNCSLAALEDWTWRGQRLDPSKRPSLASLIVLLETLYKEASKDTKE
ncbi:Dual specificity testis-specific protein kinase 1 [Portunus trituberculatus]|uniref:Dual specificity testis-specific protein kinase 1 n=1 Tax=Portunus trituberculatus TaxID=210409 RepID=A0A5B7FB87_PORTR|nr:Dual specificity testis-specific protein kinase 1 [Portunus trituberculatus]